MAPLSATASQTFTFDHGGIIRGDRSRKEIALIFTADSWGEGAPHILSVLAQHTIKAGFFLTGNFARKAEFEPLVRRMVAEGHYVGPHSDKHLLYCPWEDRERSLVTREQFEADVTRNIEALQKLGALKHRGLVYFIPPYEWFNRRHVEWAAAMNVAIFNFSPGSGSNRDYVPESDKRFVSSQKILDGILAYERKDPDGMNGYILLIHLGADRKDKMFLLLDPLIRELSGRGYGFSRIDRLLRPATDLNHSPGPESRPASAPSRADR